ncbi:MAG: signal transduction histidine kinase [Alteromonadaceae bacterium]|jgi:signal transduction histidine kinase
MQTAGFLQKDSIATQLIKIVFALYCIVTVLVTTTQIILEYQHTKTQIQNELTTTEAIFEPILRNGLWHMDSQQIQSAINGMIATPIITGVKIEQNGNLYKAVGIIKDRAGIIKQFDDTGQLQQSAMNEKSEIFSFAFTINYTFRQQPTKIGVATVYSDSSTIISRVKMGLVLLVINSVIKTIALWVLFFWVGKRILLKPLVKLINAIENIDFNNLGTFEVNLHTQGKNELTIIEHSFSTMLDNLARARNEIVGFNNALEATVTTRTSELAGAKEEAERANSVKSVFMSRINHELRTPLNAILGCTRILEEKLHGSIDENELKLIQHSHMAGEHLLMLVEDIMDVVVMNRTELAIPLGSCPLNEVCVNSIAMIQDQADQKNIQVSFSPTSQQVWANAGRLQQVLTNLLSNGIKYNHHNGKVYVFTNSTTSRYIEIIVEDTGVGISEENLNIIFEPLVRLHYAERNGINGSGIGLAIVKSLVEQMQGTIRVISQTEIGSKFIITLPTGES